MCGDFFLFIDDANTSVISTGESTGANVVYFIEGENRNISCISTGTPVPTITWTFNSQSTPFTQTDHLTDHNVIVTGSGTALVATIVTPGNVVSTLHIVNAQYPTNSGEYVCSGSNINGVSTSARIMLDILSMPTIIKSNASVLIFGIYSFP